mmetsp:Transcript_9854/g.27915  ORF Transcript_9854/g.27915 Transcript_9854/m.27915 type:complete len:200 (+) Transcript_9854:203-802(+)
MNGWIRFFFLLLEIMDAILLPISFWKKGWHRWPTPPNLCLWEILNGATRTTNEKMSSADCIVIVRWRHGRREWTGRSCGSGWLLQWRQQDAMRCNSMRRIILTPFLPMVHGCACSCGRGKMMAASCVLDIALVLQVLDALLDMNVVGICKNNMDVAFVMQNWKWFASETSFEHTISFEKNILGNSIVVLFQVPTSNPQS